MNTTRQSYTDKSEAEKVKLKTGIEIGAKKKKYIYIYIYIYIFEMFDIRSFKKSFFGSKGFFKIF